VGVSIANIYHTPATVANASMAWEVAKFGTTGTAAVINQIGDRQQMAWFMPFALDWAPSSNMGHPGSICRFQENLFEHTGGRHVLGDTHVSTPRSKLSLQT
jgi:hypothetical protein